MAQLEISEIILDPDFTDPVQLIHRKPFVDQYGQNQLEEEVIPTFGSVQPISGKMLQRVPDALKVSDVRTFWIQGTIVSDGQCQYPDLIVFRGQRFAVQTVLDWMNFGESYCEGLCVREKPTQ